MTNREKKERRRAAGLKGLATRQARAAAGRPPVERAELLRRAAALGIERERAFWRRVQELRAGRPAEWSPATVAALAAVLGGPDS